MKRVPTIISLGSILLSAFSCFSFSSFDLFRSYGTLSRYVRSKKNTILIKQLCHFPSFDSIIADEKPDTGARTH